MHTAKDCGATMPPNFELLANSWSQWIGIGIVHRVDPATDVRGGAGLPELTAANRLPHAGIDVAQIEPDHGASSARYREKCRPKSARRCAGALGSPIRRPNTLAQAHARRRLGLEPGAQLAAGGGLGEVAGERGDDRKRLLVDREPGGPPRVDREHVAKQIRVAQPRLELDHALGQLVQRLAQAARALEPRRQHALLQELELEQHVLLGREVEVEARPRHPGFARDAGHVRPGEADTAELGDRGLEQARAGGIDLALAAPGQGGRQRHGPSLAWVLTPVNLILRVSEPKSAARFSADRRRRRRRPWRGAG